MAATAPSRRLKSRAAALPAVSDEDSEHGEQRTHAVRQEPPKGHVQAV